MDKKFQGTGSRSMFHGETENKTIKKVYGESAQIFSNTLKDNLEAGEYSLIDLGSHKGEFLHDFLKTCPSSLNFETTAVDVNEDDLKENLADNKFLADLTNLPFKDKAFDVTFARYAIAWNSIADQEKILDEIVRITKKIAIIQHQGASSRQPQKLQKSSNELFSGVVPVLKREKFCFTSSREIKSILNKIGVRYKIIQNRKVKNLSELLIEKYQLPVSEAEVVKKILRGTDYIYQTTFFTKILAVKRNPPLRRWISFYAAILGRAYVS